MRTPGFTATTTLDTAASRYGAAATGGNAGVNLLRPAAAIYMDGRFVCYGEVTPNGFINCYPSGGGGGGGGSPRCRPACGRCQADSDSPTGRSRFCIRANCDDYTRPC